MKKISVFFCILLLFLALIGCSEAYKAEFSEEEKTVVVGSVFTPDVIVRPKNVEYTIQSANNAVLSVNGKEVTALTSGITTLTLISGSRTDEMTVYVVEEGEIGGGEPVFTDPAYVEFHVINYASAQLESDLIRKQTMMAGTDITGSFPLLTGYSLTWFTDEDGTEPIPARVYVKKGVNSYYAVAREEENKIILDEEHRVKGLTYRNLDHKNMNFPAEINGMVVTGIADSAFYGDTTIESITIPSTYTYIGKFAFAGCTNLKKVRFEEGSTLSEIGAFAFGPTYTEPEKKKEDISAEDSEILAYLDSLLSSVGLSQLTGATVETEEEDIKINEDYLSKLSSFSLPDSVKTVGPYAFYNCSALDTALSENLETINYGAFYGSKITVADLKNVKKIDAYAFYECADLAEVKNTQNVTSCGGYAFSETALYKEQIKKKSVVYAGSIAVGAYAGLDRITLAHNTTLIADYAFNNSRMQNLTVEFEHGVTTKIGWQSFYVVGYQTETKNFPIFSDTLFLAVSSDEVESYRRDNSLLADRFCERVQITENDPTSVNFGIHKLLKTANGKYIYDRFITSAGESGEVQPVEIDLSLLPHGLDIVRLNSYAFESLPDLAVLRLGRVEKVSDFSVSDCGKLKLIDCTKAVVASELATNNAFQFSGLDPECIVLVTQGDYGAFSSAWSGRTTAKSRLWYVQEITLHVGEETHAEEMSTCFLSGICQKYGVTEWYLDAGLTVQTDKAPVGATDLYGKR